MKTQIDEDQIVASLLIKAETQGYVIVDDILELLPDLDDSYDPVDRIISLLTEAGIQVQDINDEDEDEGDLYFLDDEEEEEDDRDDIAGISADDSIGLYLREMARVPLLTTAEEIKLAKKIDHAARAKVRLESSENHLKPDDALKYSQVVEEGRLAREHLIKANTRLVVSIAKKYMGRGVPFLDLIQEGNLGLMKAVEKYNHRLGFRFSTYATWWIRQTITRAIADQARTIRIPVHLVETINKLSRVQRRMTQEMGQEPTTEDLAMEMNLLTEAELAAIMEAQANHRAIDPALERRLEQAVKYVQDIMRVSAEPISLETPVGSEQNSLLGDFIEDQTEMSPMDSATLEMLKEQVRSVLTSLSERERNVLEMRFGFRDGKTHTLEEVGQMFGVTRERVRQIEAKALRKLRHPHHSRRLRDYLSDQ